MPSSARQEPVKRRLPSVGGRLLAAMCKAASDPLRLDVMRALSKDSFGVQELAAIFAMPQPGMSHHLKVLAQSGLLVTRREGNSIFYRRALPKGEGPLHDLHASLFTAIDALPLAPDYQSRIDGIHAERSEQSRLFFERHADRFAENQGMLCELGQYEPGLKELLDLLELPHASRALEIGPGQGQLLQELQARFDAVVGLDSSEEMLAHAKTRLAGNPRVTFTLGSLESYACGDERWAPFDVVAMNMVLHHMPSPLQALQKVRSLLREGGFLVVADLCSHHQEWARSSCGDVWLGFEPQDLRDWAAAAGLAEEQSSYLGLKNGFQIQLKLFRAL
jgi:ArsR family transcriptional regulator